MVEQVKAGVTAERARVVLFDFDGTLSLIRSGWMDVMVPQMVAVLAATRSGESEAELTEVVREFVGRLTGKDTIYQMMELAEQVRARGGTPADPKVYKKMYLDGLHEVIKDRLEALRQGGDPAPYLVPGSIELLNELRERGFTMYLASGTDDANVKEEAALLGLTPYFAGVHGAQDDYQSFSKAILIRRIIESAEFRGEEFLGFGDGYVEIENVKQVGGVAVGVATAEPACLAVDDWKRNRLVGVGADYIVPNYLHRAQLFAHLFPGRN